MNVALCHFSFLLNHLIGKFTFFLQFLAVPSAMAAVIVVKLAMGIHCSQTALQAGSEASYIGLQRQVLM